MLADFFPIAIEVRAREADVFPWAADLLVDGIAGGGKVERDVEFAIRAADGAEGELVIIPANAEAVPHGLVGIGDAFAGGIAEAGELGALHDEQAAVGVHEDAERFVEAFGEDFPILAPGIEIGDLSVMKGDDEAAIRRHVHAADLGIDSRRHRQGFDFVK